MNYVVVDLEATCWEKGTSRDRMEMIEIGAVYLDGRTMEPLREFEEFVRPIEEPTLSKFCRKLTTIRQKDVDTADTFPAVFNRFIAWIGDEPFTLVSWGAYDLGQFKMDCERHKTPFPETFDRHLNLKKAFAQWREMKKACGMKAALRMLNLPLIGTHHRGIDDSRNIAKILVAYNKAGQHR